MAAHRDEVFSQQDLVHFEGSAIAMGLDEVTIDPRENNLFFRIFQCSARKIINGEIETHLDVC